MTRSLKVLGLTLVAISASALSASSASATDLFTTSKGTAWVTATSHNWRYTVPNVAIFECTTSQFTGTFTNGASEMTAHITNSGEINATPHKSECSGLGAPTAFRTNDCHYRFTGNTTGSDEGKFDATTWIECPVGQKIEIETTNLCLVRIPSQTSTGGGVVYTNRPNHAGGSAIQVTMTITGTTYEAQGFGCTLGGLPTHGDDFDLLGTIIVTGYEDNGGTLTAPTEGARIPIEIS